MFSLMHGPLNPINKRWFTPDYVGARRAWYAVEDHGLGYAEAVGRYETKRAALKAAARLDPKEKRPICVVVKTALPKPARA